MTTEVLLYGNDNVLEIRGLRNEVTGTFLNSATVTVTLKDSAGTNVTGTSWPKALAYVASSDGVYRATLAHDLGLTPAGRYTATIAVDGGAGLVARWDVPCLCKTRS